MAPSGNPLGIKDLDHLEFTADNFETPTLQIFRKLGFTLTHESKVQKAQLYSQGQVRFVLKTDSSESAHSRRYFNRHGEGVSKMSFWVDNAEVALNEAVKRGANLVEDLRVEKTPAGVIKYGSIQGVGDVLNEFVERPGSEFRESFVAKPVDQEATPLQVRFSRVDHLTNNVPKGEMDRWADFYRSIYGMEEIRYFDIKGSKTGLFSRAMGLSNRKVIIPINEPEEKNGRSQIQEYLDLHKGPGVQHIALMTPDIISSVGELQARQIRFLSVPSTYYEDIPKRKIQVEEDLQILEQRQILVDGNQDGYLLQNFTDTYIGPLFFEVIQRKNNWGFGEGNFKALFEAIERDQMKRGYLK